jgi:hypothetical protein
MQPTYNQHGDQPGEERRQAALAAFLGAGLPASPCIALMVQSLASARRAVAEHQQRGEAFDQWLASEVRQRGVRENAAVLSVMETPGHREETSRAYREHHPDRTGVLNDLLALRDQA